MRALVVTAVAAAFAFAPTVSSALSFNANYEITSQSADPGLVVHTHKLSDPLNFNLNVGESTGWIPLFDIWTDETAVNSDDRANSPIDVEFTFNSPSFIDGVDGVTSGRGFVFPHGSLTWDDPVDFNFGPDSLAILRVRLSDVTFNKGFFGLNPGEKHGATVKAKFKLLVEPSSSVVPVPAALPLLASAMLGLGVLSLRRRRR